MSVLTAFIVKKYKPEPNRNLEKTNRTVSSEPRVTDFSVNRGSPGYLIGCWGHNYDLHTGTEIYTKWLTFLLF